MPNKETLVGTEDPSPDPKSRAFQLANSSGIKQIARELEPRGIFLQVIDGFDPQSDVTYFGCQSDALTYRLIFGERTQLDLGHSRSSQIDFGKVDVVFNPYGLSVVSELGTSDIEPSSPDLSVELKKSRQAKLNPWRFLCL